MTKKSDDLLDALAHMLYQSASSPEVESLVQQLRKNMLSDLRQNRPPSTPTPKSEAIIRADPLFWDKWFLGLAAYVSTASKDPSTQVGAVVVRPDRTVASLGFNGFPRNVEDDIALYTDREEKLKRILHAEQNALLFAKENLDGCTIYLYPLLPCARCAGMIIQKGIKKIVSPVPTQDQLARWGQDFDIAKDMFKQAGVELLTLK